MTALSFKSYRTPDAGQPAEAEAPEVVELTPVPDAATEANDQRTRTLVLSPTKGLSEMVARGLARDEALDVRHRHAALADLDPTEEGLLDSTDLIVFEVRAGNDADLSVLRQLKAAGGEGLKFLGITTEILSLGTARALIDAGLSEVFSLSDMAPDAAQAQSLGQAADTATGGGAEHNGMILAVAAARGGIGATSFALNLATVLARPGKGRKAAPPPKVAVVDLDYQNGVLGAAIDVDSTGVYLEMLQSGTLPDRAFVRQAFARYEDGGFDVMAAPRTFAPLDAMQPEMMAALLDELRLACDYVVLDLPRALVDWIDAILARADRFFILGDTSVHTVRQMRRMKELYLDSHATLPLEFVVSLEKKGLSSGSALKEAERFLDAKLDHWIAPDLRAARSAADRGMPILLRSPKAKPAKAVDAIVKSVQADFASNRRRRA